RQSIQIKDQLASRGHVLPGLVNEEEYVLSARSTPDQVQHLGRSITRVFGQREAERSEGPWLWEFFGIELGCELVGVRHSQQWIVVHFVPWLAEPRYVCLPEFSESSVAVQAELQVS